MYKYIGLADSFSKQKGEQGRQLILLEFAQNLTAAVSVRIRYAINIDNFQGEDEKNGQNPFFGGQIQQISERQKLKLQAQAEIWKKRPYFIAKYHSREKV